MEDTMEPLERSTHRSTTCPDDGLATFLAMRPRLFGLVCRMLRNAAEAEDIVQDVWVRWHTADRTVVRNPAAFLVTTATRLAINVRQSARSRREAQVESSLPEGVDTRIDPGVSAERRQALARGILALLEKLTPTERAAYILREAFDYSYRDIATVLRLGEANARQVVTRARQHVAGGPRMAVNPAEQRRLLDAVLAATRTGDVAGLQWTLGGRRRGRVSTPQAAVARSGSIDGSGARPLRVAV
jgi:RNA polymerase sigma-70 factor (ECF subfamily)